MTSNVTPASTNRNAREDRRGHILRSSLFLVLVVAAVWYLARRPIESAVPQTTVACDAEPEDTAVTSAAEVQKPAVSYTVKRGDTFAGILARFGIVERLAVTYYRNLVDVGLAALFPGDSLVLELSADSTLQSLSLLNRWQCWYRITCRNNRLVSGCYPLETAIHRCSVKGTLNTSLSHDMYALGEGDGLVGQLTEIFAWDINFFTDPRKGDRFEVIFEKHYAGGRFAGYGDVLAARYHGAEKTFTAFGLRDSSGKMRYYDAEGKSVQKQFLKAPLRYSRISSGYSFSRKHPILGIYRPHLGIDYAAPRGTPVYAAADGTVEYSGWMNGYGNFVRLVHGASYTTCYGHLHRINSGIRKGTRVTQGQMLGTVGSTGLATGPHLDYRMKVGNRYVNPLTVILPSGEAVPDKRQSEFAYTRMLCSLMLDMRFGGAEGSWVVDIRMVQPTPSERITHITDNTVDASSTGS